MIVYLDTSVLLSAYLRDEPRHRDSVALFERHELGLVTGELTRVEAAGALRRAERARRVKRAAPFLAGLAADLADGGDVVALSGEFASLCRAAEALTASLGCRALDALHIVLADEVARPLLEPGEELRFATFDTAQAAAAEAAGLDLYDFTERP